MTKVCRAERVFISEFKGFTLVELLVVTSVIGVMIALLLPSLARSKEAARRAICGAKQHQVVVASTAYAYDAKQYWPRTVRDDGFWHPYWIGTASFNQLNRYAGGKIGTAGVSCPNVVVANTAVYSPGVGYAVNFQLLVGYPGTPPATLPGWPRALTAWRVPVRLDDASPNSPVLIDITGSSSPWGATATHTPSGLRAEGSSTLRISPVVLGAEIQSTSFADGHWTGVVFSRTSEYVIADAFQITTYF